MYQTLQDWMPGSRPQVCAQILQPRVTMEMYFLDAEAVDFSLGQAAEHIRAEAHHCKGISGMKSVCGSIFELHPKSPPRLLPTMAIPK